VGRFAEGALRRALAGLEVEIASVLHPSPANPQANRGWAARADARMQELGVLSQDTL
jgi:single-strand selective monofunctional uracil DNA glycosylase